MEQRLRLPKLLSKGCVLQQEAQTRIWGWCAPDSRVLISLEKQNTDQEGAVWQRDRRGCDVGSGNSKSGAEKNAENRIPESNMQEQYVTADANGRFETVFAGLEPGGPYILRVSDDYGEQREVREVYVGDVYVCGGQSNMELPMRRVRERFPEEFLNGGAPGVHLYKVQEHYDFAGPLEDHVNAEWKVCSSENLEEISAFSYFLGKELWRTRKVPIGIINLSLGGTPAEAWTSREGLEGKTEYLELRSRYQDDEFRRTLMEQKEREEREWYEEIVRQEEMFAAGIWKELNLPEDVDGGKIPNYAGGVRSLEEGTYSCGSWKAISLPGYLSDVGLTGFCGCIWLRRAFDVSGEYAGHAGLLRFGTMTDSDRIYVNGVLVGETGYSYPPRRYPIPEGLLREGKNEIMIRLICRNGGGRVTPGKPYEIVWKDDCGSTDPVRLDGQWEYQVRALCSPAPEQEFINRRPTGLFQGMVAPCLPYTVSGAVWYQGESNDCRPENYGELLEAMITDWRKQWQQERLPFVVVQLPNCGIDIAGGDAWPQIREAQRQAGKLPDTAVTVNLDIGEDNDLHPLDKETAAKRAALALRSMVYGEAVNWKGPEVISWSVQDDRVSLEFETHDGGDLFPQSSEGKQWRFHEKAVCSVAVIHGSGKGKPGHVQETESGNCEKGLFEVSDEDGHFYQADFRISGRKVILYSRKVKKPCAVRYAWSPAPGAILLKNGSGLCASPFRFELK